MPFAGYKNFDECVRKNKDKGDPKAYCGAIKHKVEDVKDLLAEIMEDENLVLEDKVIKRGEHARCVDRLEYLGFSEQEANVMCAALYLQDTKASEMTMSECIKSRMAQILANHDVSKDKAKQMARERCEGRAKSDTKLFGEKEEPTKKTRKHFKYRYDPRTRHHGGHPTHVEIGVVPRPLALPLQAPHRPPKSQHEMRTKMERIQTEEEKFLNLQELAKRAQYQREVKKTGGKTKGTKKHQTMRLYRKDTSLVDLLDDIQNLFPEMGDKEAIEFGMENNLIDSDLLYHEQVDFSDSMKEKIDNGTKQHEAYIETLREFYVGTSYAEENIVLDASKSSLKNSKRIPVILAREIIQKYRGDEGIEKHYKPFGELKKAIDKIDELPIIIEHKRFNDNDVVGYVKELYADKKDRSIKGYAYLRESRLPTIVQKAMDAGETIPVSIGFHAQMGDSGEYLGEPYDKTQENIILNHLALVFNSKPRCPPNLCGLNLDSFSDSKNDEGLVLIKKPPQYYNIGDSEEKENIKDSKKGEEEIMTNTTNHILSLDSEYGDILNKIFDKDKDVTEEEKEEVKKKLEEEKEEDSTPGWIIDLVLSKLDEVLPLPVKRDSIKMAEDNKLKELESKIAELEDSLSEKEEKIRGYEEEKRQRLCDSILSISNKYDRENLEDMCLDELKIREDAVSEFKPTQKKPKRLPSDEEVKDSSRINPQNLWTETNEKFNL